MTIKNLSSASDIFSSEIFYAPASKAIYFFIRDFALFLLFSLLIIKTDKLYFLFPLWIFHGLSLLSLFQLAHDFAHGALLKNKYLSWWLAQICMLPVLHPVNQWVYGHNGIHHRNTSKLKADLAWHPRTSDRYKSMNLLDKLLHRIYWSSFGTGIYYFFKMWLQGLILYPAPDWKAKRDISIVVIFLLISSAFVVYCGGIQENQFNIFNGIWLFAKLQLIPFIIWNYTIGIIVYLHHINKKIVWKKSEEWTSFYGQVQATTNYKLPLLINFFAHNIMVHSPHHVHTKIPFYNLPIALDIMREHYSSLIYEGISFWSDYFDSTRSCKLIDSKTGRWINFTEL